MKMLFVFLAGVCYKDGKGIFVRKDEDALARAQNLRADLLWIDDKLLVTLSGDLTPLPEALRLLFIFPTAKAGDVSVLLHYIIFLFLVSASRGAKSVARL